MEGLRHTLNVENKFIGQATTHRYKLYHEVKNPRTSLLLGWQIARAHYCMDHDCHDLTKWFVADTGITPQEFINKWKKPLTRGNK